MRAIKRLVLLTIMILTPAVASAQAETDSNVFWDVTKAWCSIRPRTRRRHFRTHP